MPANPFSTRHKVTTVTLDRRGFLRASGVVAGSVGFASFLSACAGSEGDDGAGTLTLRMPFLQDMQVPDPDIMYEGEGVQIMTSCYEGLVLYEPGTGKILPKLAESWTVSDDQLTYTFKLIPDVKFHDGTPADADAWIKSFERRLAVNEGPAYMVAGVADMKAPDPTTFVVTLADPNNAFLHYAACPWQMYAVSPTAVEKNAEGDDLAKKWISEHDAGTGPYVMSEFVPGSHHTLEAFDGYWGDKPYFETVRIEILPEIATQKLKLDQGELDLVSKGFAIPDVKAYADNPDFEVITSFGASVIVLWMNPLAGIFADKALRQAMMTALDRQSIVDTAFQGFAEVEENFWPEKMFPAVLSPVSLDYDTAPLAALVSALDSTEVDLAWSSSMGAPAQTVAELVQTQLAPIGLDVTVRAMPSAETFDLVNQPPEKRPDLLVWVIGGDALHLDTVLRIQLRTGAKPLNPFGYANPEFDRLMDEAITKPTEEATNEVYLQITEIIRDDALWVPLCVNPVNFVGHKYIEGVELNPFSPALFAPNKIARA